MSELESPSSSLVSQLETRSAASEGNDLFLRNMRTLWRHEPTLALRIDAVRDDERLPLERTRSGAWTARVPLSDGQSAYLHSRYDPQAEARRFAEAVPLSKDASGGEKPTGVIGGGLGVRGASGTHPTYCFVVAGLGLGYHVLALLERLRGDSFIVCTEPSLPLISTALTCVDLSDCIASGRLILLVDADKARLHDRLRNAGTLMMLGTHFVRHAPSVRAAPEAQQAIHDAIAEFVTYTRMSLLTLVSNSRITCKNIAMNLSTYASTPPIDILRNRFAGDPAVVISAGPSPARNIDQLAGLKGRAVLCAVQTAVKPLMRRGIVPEFVTSLDFHEMSRKFFDGVEGLEDTHLVAEPKATWHVVDAYPGPVSLLDNAWARLVIGDKLGARSGLKAGATVAHLAFYLAVYLGCDPVLFVGQDLAFTGHVFYVPGVEVHRSWRGELNRFHTMEQKEWERIVRNRPILRRVPGVDGEELYTDELLLTYLEQFEKDIAGVPVRVINATEGGARIRGTEQLTLAEAAERYCRRPIDPARFAYRKAQRWRDPARLPEARDEVAARIDELDAAVTVCEETLGLLEELKDLTHDAKRFNKRLVRIDELRARVSQESRAYCIINAATQLAELRRFSADRRISAEEHNEVARAKAQIARDIDFVTAVRDGAREVKPILVEARERIELAMEEGRRQEAGGKRNEGSAV